MKKLNVKIVIPIILVAIVVIVIIIFMNKGISEKDCIGTWEIANNDNHYIQTIILYKGGTGKGLTKGSDESSAGYTISWEIQDGILNITVGSSDITRQTTGYELEKNTITSLDGVRSYNKVK